MKTAIAIFVFCGAACFSTPLWAQEAQKDGGLKPAAPPDLVETAKQAKAKRKKSSTKVITNKDVKKAKAKLIILSTPVDDKPPAPTETTGPLQKQDTKYRDRKEAEERFDAAQKKVDGLQKELASIEQQYYEENDPNYRDEVIQKRFAQTKRQLEEARHELANARDALTKIDS